MFDILCLVSPSPLYPGCLFYRAASNADAV